MTILLFGGSGIISKEICAEALSRGDSVSIFNRGKRQEHINLKAHMIQGDFRRENVDNIIAKIDGHYDVIIDFLSYIPREISKMISIVRGRCNQFIYISSATVYTEINKEITEKDAATNTLWSYAQLKKECEDIVSKSDLNYTIIRPYITYGETRIPNQFSPLEYYTLINRIKIKKPVLLTREEISTTITHSKDFAKGSYALLLNELAYGEIFNIVGCYRTTWSEILDILVKKIDIQPTIIRIPLEYLKKRENKAYFNIQEVIGDKGRQMLFDNSKILSIAPEMSESIRYETAIDEILEYFKEPTHQVINYAWDAAIDNFIEMYCRENNYPIDNQLLSVDIYGKSLSIENQKTYLKNRTPFNRLLNKVNEKILHHTR